MAIRLQPMSTIFHTVVLEQLKKTDLLEQLSQRNCGPQKTTPSPASVLHHVLADQQHGLTKNDTQCLAPGCESKNITKRVSHKKNTKNSDGKNKTQWASVGEMDYQQLPNRLLGGTRRAHGPRGGAS